MATIEPYTAQRLREEFANPLAQLVAKFVQQASDLDRAVADKRMKRDYLPLKAKGAKDAMVILELFLENQVEAKRKQAERGVLKYREKEYATKRKKPERSK